MQEITISEIYNVHQGEKKVRPEHQQLRAVSSPSSSRQENLGRLLRFSCTTLRLDIDQTFLLLSYLALWKTPNPAPGLPSSDAIQLWQGGLR